MRTQGKSLFCGDGGCYPKDVNKNTISNDYCRLNGRRKTTHVLSPPFFFALQIRVDGTTKNTLEYEIVQVVDTGPILRDMAFSMDHEHLYIMSEKQVRSLVRPVF